MSLEELDLLNDESDEIGSDSGYSVTYYFCTLYLPFDKFVGSVSVLGSDIFAPTGVDSKRDIFVSGLFIPTGVEFKGGGLLEMFWRSNSLFSFQI